MASVIDDPGGKRRISFVGSQGRKTIYLGKVSRKAADSLNLRVETILAANEQGQALDVETAGWLARRPDTFYKKLAATGLVPPRDPLPETKPTTLGSFVDQYISGRADVKSGTATNLRQARKKLVEYFGEDKPLSAITPGDADQYRQDLLSRLGDNTARRHCGRAKQFFRAAVRKRLIAENPFGDQKGLAVRANPSRFYFLSREDAQAVLNACPDAQWRLIFALSRFGGLRCPSEHLALRWGDVDWERNRITIHSPKTEHHEGGESRQIPLFPELQPFLEEVFEQTVPGTEFVINRYRNSNANLRTQLERIIKRAGLTAWPKLFQNLRSTRETELAQSYPIHVVCAWLGNSQRVAAKHYLQVRDEDFERAASYSAESSALSTESTAQNTAQPPSADSRQPSQETHNALENQGLCYALADVGESWQDRQVTPTGFEPVLQA